MYIGLELTNPFRDERSPYKAPTTKETFYMLTKETPETINVGKVVTAEVTGLSNHHPPLEEMNVEDLSPIYNEERRSWQCPICMAVSQSLHLLSIMAFKNCYVGFFRYYPSLGAQR